jgi:sporulation protein YlmC with PRC-barrel domain
MNLEIGAEVLGRDGKLGTLTRIVFAPQGNRITHVVVERGGLHPWEKVVPISAIARSEGHQLWLTLDFAQVKDLPDYLETEGTAPGPAVPADVPMGDPRPVGLLWPSNVLGWYLPANQPTSPGHLHENLPPGSHGLRSGTEVHCRDGMAGHLEEVRYDEATGRATGMVIRKGFLFTRDLEAPIDWVETIDDSIRLRVTCDELRDRSRKRD